MAESFDVMAGRLRSAVAPYKKEKKREQDAMDAAKLKADKERAEDMALMPNLEKELDAIRNKIAANFKEKGPHGKGIETMAVDGSEYFFRSVGTSAKPFLIEMGQLKPGVFAENIGDRPFPDVQGNLVRVGFDPVSGMLSSISFVDCEKVMSSIAPEGSLAAALDVSTVEYGSRDMEDFRRDLSEFDVRHEFSKGRFEVMKEKIQPFLNAFANK